ncbi:MAG TPA: YihY/virulence factor BrkB family protein, partial [Chloroflexota bacterium]|jgi:YihY family inner membrane protein|nr:YihY/virulence factor BrkB family protein [Chloroflexota bacterium]
VLLVLAMVLVLALLPGTAYDVNGFAAQVNRILPAGVRKDINIIGLIDWVHGASGPLALITIIGLLWGGTNLFGSIENAFAFIYRVKTRDLLLQKVMALLLILLFVVLLPLSFVSSLLLGAATTTLGSIMPGYLDGPFSAVVGFIAGLFALFLLFVAIYTIVPNRPVAWRHAWRGALIASVAMLLVNTAFPFYAAHFIGQRQYGAATIGTVIITITWVWFFSLVLLLGAQINALGMGLAPWKYDITRILMEVEGPQLELKYRRRSGRHHPGLPFSGLVHDSYKVRKQVSTQRQRAQDLQATGTPGAEERQRNGVSGLSS